MIYCGKSLLHVLLLASVKNTISKNTYAAWSESITLTGDVAGDAAGFAVALSSDGTTVAYGAYKANSKAGLVRVLNYNGSAWVQVGGDLTGDAEKDYAGKSVALSNNGTTIAIGAPGSFSSSSNGYVRVLNYNGSSWVQVGGDLTGVGGDLTGAAVALSNNGTTVAYGAPGANGITGYVRVQNYNGSSWVQVGGDFIGAAGGNSAGSAVALSSDGTTVAYSERGFNSNTGFVRVQNYDGASWVQVGGDLIGDAPGDNSGWHVALSSDGTTVAYGAPARNPGGDNRTGYVRVQNYNGSSWVQVGGDLTGDTAGDQAGDSVALSSDGTTVEFGAPAAYNAISLTGYVRVLNYNGASWVQVGGDLIGDAAADTTGSAVALSNNGTTIAFGAPLANCQSGRICERAGTT